MNTSLPPVLGQELVGDSRIREFNIPVDAAGPLGIVATDTIIWFTLDGANSIASFDPRSEEFETYPIPWEPEEPVNQYGLDGIGVDREGFIWFTHGSTNRIGRLDPGTNTFEEFMIPSANALPIGLLIDPAGNVWFSELLADKIGVVTTDGRVLEFALPTPSSGPAGLYLAADGNLWFTEAFGGRVGYLDPTTGFLKEFTPPQNITISSPVGIAVDDEGIVWMADHGGSEIVRFDPETEEWKEFVTSEAPADIFPVSLPNDLEIDADGFLWIAEHTGNKIARFDTKSGRLTEYRIPTHNPVVLWLSIAPNGLIWFAQAQSNKIGVLEGESPPFALSLSESRVVVSAGGVASIGVDIQRSQDFNGDLELLANPENLPRISVSFSPTVLSSGNRGRAEITIPGDLEPGLYPISISAVFGDVLQTETVLLEITSGVIGTNSGQNSNQLTIIILSVAAIVVISSLIFIRQRRGKVRTRKRSR